MKKTRHNKCINLTRNMRARLMGGALPAQVMQGVMLTFITYLQCLNMVPGDDLCNVQDFISLVVRIR